MKLDKIYSGITILLCFLISYAFYSYAPLQAKMLHTIGSFIFLLITGLGLIATKFNEQRTTINIKTVSGVFFILGIILNIISSIFHFNLPAYIIIAGISLTVYFLIVYSIEKQRQ